MSNEEPKQANFCPKPIMPTTPESYNGDVFDRALHAYYSHFIGFLSPASFRLAWSDWFSHLLINPAKQQDILHKATENFQRFMMYAADYQNNQQCSPCITTDKNDHRFHSAAWNTFPYNIYSQGFMLMQQLWGECTRGIPGVEKHHRNFVDFFGRQILDMFSPSNFPWTNPNIIAKTVAEGGRNFLNGFNNLIEDTYRHQMGLPAVGTEEFLVGINVAATPGKVVYRNHLIELIQYEPTTKKVYAEPILIVPAWIMKYYILDLSPHNSLVKYLVEQGHTVFMISWKNPTREDRDLSLADYVNLGVMAALTAVNTIVPQQQVHAVGYCIGGTLLMMAAAAMEGHSSQQLKTITLFAAQIDFEEAGEILLFVDESQVSYLEDIMWQTGYLDGAQMGGAFSMLRSADLIWSRLVTNYLLGEREPLNDLMAWDADTTRLPYKMHAQYLRSLFLNNDLVQGRFEIADKKLMLPNIKVPIFCVSTLTDHVAPWKSVYKIHYFTDTDITFVLTSGGHNAGIISEPGHPNRNYQMMMHAEANAHVTPESWQQEAPHYDGSWWPAWEKWLVAHGKEKVAPPTMGAPDTAYATLCDAPGVYVLEK